jgi:hypothetical protein
MSIVFEQPLTGRAEGEGGDGSGEICVIYVDWDCERWGISLEELSAFTAKHAMKAQGGEEVLLYSFFKLGARCGGWSTPHPCRFTPGNAPVTIV